MDIGRGRLPARVLAELAVKPAVTEQAAALANAIAEDAAQLAPVQTGNLQRNITVEEIRHRNVTGFIVGWALAAYYGRFLELGTQYMAPRPHLVPAAIKHGAVAPRSEG